MRPKILTMRAFGPYGGTETIDFTLLEDTNMFLIHGPTGSGKTTILDAICYALYGQTNGGERTAESMRSKFAASDESAEVTLTFLLKGDEYKVIRSPRFERPKKRGEGFTVEEGKALLYKKEDDEYKLVAARLQEVDRRIEELLVFNIDQFRQVIMIAQNKFRELLTADSKARQKILQDIFETGIYQSVEKKLEERSSKLNEQMKAKNVQYEIFMSNLKEIEHEELKFYLETKILKNAPEVSRILTELNEQYSVQLDESNTQATDIKVALDKAQQSLLIQNEKYAAFKQLEQLQEALKIHLEEKETIKTYQEQVSKLEQVVPLVTIEEEGNKFKEGVAKTKEALITLQSEQQVLNEQLGQLENTQKEYEAKHEEIETQKGHIIKLEGYVPKMDALDQLQQDILKKEADIVAFNAKKEQLVEAFTAKEQQIKVIEEQLKEKEVFNKIISDTQVNLQQVDYILDFKKEQARKQEERLQLLGQYKVLGGEIKALKLQELAKQQEHDLYVEQWMSGQAGILAEKLEDNTPCPVCGSMEHPRKAVKLQNEVTMEDIKRIEAIKNQLLTQMSKKEEEQNGILTRGKSIQEDITVIESKLKNYEIQMSVSVENITVEYKENLQKTLEEAKVKITQLQQLELKLASDKKEKETLQTTLESIKEKYHNDQIEIEKDKSKLEEIKKEVPQDLRSKEALLESIQSLKSIQAQYENSYKLLQQKLQETKEKLSLLKGTLEQKNLYLAEQENGLEDAHKRFKDALEHSNILGLESYQALKGEVVHLENLKQQIASYEQQTAILNSKKEMLEAQAQGFKLEDFETVKVEFEQLTNKKEELQLAIVELTRQLKLYEEVQTGIEKLYEESEEVARKQHVIGTMTAMAKGKNSKGLSFERYIQSSIFDEVLESANQKLRPMTTSRYELYRTDDLRRKNAQAGLDIAVIDHYVGQTRPVNTLSGGESFMAALALALGLADVISRLAGASSLDTMFIDEGFGTLDEEALELAIKTLLNLQDTGRLVGIISHVKELREQIPARLEIVSTHKGSTATFKL